MGSGYVEISMRTVRRALVVAAVLGVALGAIGLRDAYAKVGLRSSAGWTVTVAAVLMFSTTAIAIVWAMRRSRTTP